ncbi:hypothetical protein [Treponema sp.]|uniref:hypothetical protein n=1 Tax=Treponema sp. TaxID=166 RepID=UPI003F0A7C61
MGGYYEVVYSELGLPKRKLQTLTDMLSGCECCQATYDREDDRTYFHAPHQSFEDLLDDIGFTEAQKEKIYDNYVCPNCGCDLNAFSEVTTNEYYQEEKFYEKYIKKITANVKTKIDDFYEYFIKYPYLSCNHSVGKQIIKGIDSLVKLDIDNQIYYRAREPKDSAVFTTDDMLPPSPQKVPISEGRFNHFGQVHWYLSDSETLCGAECSHKKNCILWFQKVKINKASCILDLAKDYIDYSFIPDNTKIYDLPVVVAALLLSRVITKKQETKGINGILFPDSLLPGKNLVIFDINKIQYEFDGKPELKEYNFQKEYDDDLYENLGF